MHVDARAWMSGDESCKLLLRCKYVFTQKLHIARTSENNIEQQPRIWVSYYARMSTPPHVYAIGKCTPTVAQHHVFLLTLHHLQASLLINQHPHSCNRQKQLINYMYACCVKVTQIK